MMLFILGALVLTALALFSVFLPFIRETKKASSAAAVPALDEENRARAQENVRLHQERLAELQQDLQRGSITNEDFERLKSEAEVALYEDAFAVSEGASEANASVASGAKLPKSLLLGLSLFLLLASGLIYDQVGAFSEAQAFVEQGLTPKELAAQHRERQRMEQAVANRDMDTLVKQLYEKLQANPENIEGWLLLGRSAMSTGNFELAEEAYLKVIELAQAEDENPAPFYGLLAQTRYYAAGEKILARVQEAIDQALLYNPDEVNVLALLAMHAFSQADYAQALARWQRILEVVPEHPSRGNIEQGIAEAQKRLGVAGAAPEKVAPEPVSGPEVRVSVKLAPELQGRLAPQTPVFIFARAVSGPPMPVAASRHTVAELPLQITLSDATAMGPMAKISQFEAVDVVARVSLSGQPVAQAGDWEGEVANVKVGQAQTVEVLIAREIGKQ